MIAKGLDFPNVTLVGVVDADVGVNLPDFRASERSFQLLSQVAGRAGRGPKGGEVIIQTRLPGHHAVTCALSHDYQGFVRKELPARADPPYPPLTRLVNLVVSGLDQFATADLAASLGEWIAARLGRGTLQVRVVGPAPCAVERIHRRWRWHILLKSEQPSALGAIARGVVEGFEIPARHQLRLAIDRDPVSLL
jgi:primosomal protein N' (replication factor Y)